jgi:hypothetical protein
VRCVVVVVVATEPMAQKSMRISAFCDRNKARAGGVRKTKKEKEVARGEVGRALSAVGGRAWRRRQVPSS